jgi:hypothetical protein
MGTIFAQSRNLSHLAELCYFSASAEFSARIRIMADVHTTEIPLLFIQTHQQSDVRLVTHPVEGVY